MEFIKTKNYGGPMDVVFNGGQYFFIDRWYGLVAIATRREESIGEDPAVFDVKRCRTIDPAVMHRVINKAENQFVSRNVEYHETMDKEDSLPFNLKFEAVAR